MRFLHTSDWHLGKIFYERNLLEDQKFFLEQIERELENAQKLDAPYDALLVSGDIYDRKNPTPEAAKLFSDFFTNLKKRFFDLQMFFISGNHDDATRLSYANKIIDQVGIHIASNAQNILNPIVLQKNAERAAIYSIPFIAESTQIESLGKITKDIFDFHEKNFKGAYSIVLAHTTVLGSKKNAYDENVIGTIDSVPQEFFSQFSYSALGHIHKMQNYGGKKNVWYSGSPLSYHFEGNNGKILKNYFLSVTLDSKNLKVKPILVKPLHPVVRLFGNFDDYTKDKQTQYKQYFDCYIEFCYTDPIPKENAVHDFKEIFPYALSFVKNENLGTDFTSALKIRASLFEKTGTSDQDYFEAFVREMFPAEDQNSEIFLAAKNEFLALSKQAQKILEEEE